MRKTYKEKYLELEIEKKYLLDIIDKNRADMLCELRRYKDLQEEFYIYKKDIEKKCIEEKKRSDIFDLVGLSFFAVLLLVGIILKSIGCF